jgi:hypothetical protein
MRFNSTEALLQRPTGIRLAEFDHRPAVGLLLNDPVIQGPGILRIAHFVQQPVEPAIECVDRARSQADLLSLLGLLLS